MDAFVQPEPSSPVEVVEIDRDAVVFDLGKNVSCNDLNGRSTLPFRFASPAWQEVILTP